MKLYGIANCNTVKKARVWLDEHGVAYQFHDLKKDSLDAATVNGWLQQQPWEKLVNRAGMTWRALSDDAKAAVHDSASAATLMLEKTSVIKRPVIERDGKIITIGFREAEFENRYRVTD